MYCHLKVNFLASNCDRHSGQVKVTGFSAEWRKTLVLAAGGTHFLFTMVYDTPVSTSIFFTGLPAIYGCPGMLKDETSTSNMSVSIALETTGTQDGVKLRLEPRFVFCDVGFFILRFLLVPLFAVNGMYRPESLESLCLYSCCGWGFGVPGLIRMVCSDSTHRLTVLLSLLKRASGWLCLASGRWHLP